MSLTRTVLSLAALGSLAACDTAGTDAPNANAPLTRYILDGAIQSTGDAATAGVEISYCYVDGEGRLLSGDLTLESDERFEFTYVTQRVFDTTVWPPDTSRIAGAYERHGPILRLRPVGTRGRTPNWFGTVGPTSERPITIVLGDYGPGEIFGGCYLVFIDPDAYIDRAVRGEPNPGSFALGSVVRNTENWSSAVPLPILGYGRNHNNSYHAGRLEFLSNGTYRFSLDRTWGNAYNESDTLRRVEVATGPYVASGPVYALDPGTSQMAFAVEEGDSLYVYRNYVSSVSSVYWSLDLYGNDDLLFHRE